MMSVLVENCRGLAFLYGMCEVKYYYEHWLLFDYFRLAPSFAEAIVEFAIFCNIRFV